MSTVVTSPQPAAPAPATLLTAAEFAQCYGGQYMELAKGVVKELQQIFHNGDELTVPEVLPGFAVAVACLFA
jgi:hypothetical protein